MMSELENMIGDPSFTCERAGRRLTLPEHKNIRVCPRQFSALWALVFLLGTGGWRQENAEELRITGIRALAELMALSFEMPKQSQAGLSQGDV